MISEMMQRMKVSFLALKNILPSAGHWDEEYGDQRSEHGSDCKAPDQESLSDGGYHTLAIDIYNSGITEYRDVHK